VGSGCVHTDMYHPVVRLNSNASQEHVVLSLDRGGRIFFGMYLTYQMAQHHVQEGYSVNIHLFQNPRSLSVGVMCPNKMVYSET
jgi:hypothetical protein